MPFRLDAPQHNLKKGFQDECEMRNLRGSIQEELQPLSELKTEKEFAQVYFDVVQCHHWVYTYPKILHRDISDGNIMFREEEGKIYGVLNNWDLALLDPETESFPTSKFRTGTKPFLAHEQHSSIWIGPHRYRHDLELMFYVILLQTCLHTAPTTQASLDPIPGNHQYGRWHSEDDEYLGQNKHSLIHRDPWVPPVEGSKKYENTTFDILGEPVAQASTEAFDDVTLGGKFSYNRVLLLMHRFNKQSLEIRGNEWRQKLAQLLTEYMRERAERAASVA